MTSRKLWFQQDDLNADRLGQAQKMLADAFNGVRQNTQDTHDATVQDHLAGQTDWAQNLLGQAFQGVRNTVGNAVGGAVGNAFAGANPAAGVANQMNAPTGPTAVPPPSVPSVPSPSLDGYNGLPGGGPRPLLGGIDRELGAAKEGLGTTGPPAARGIREMTGEQEPPEAPERPEQPGGLLGGTGLGEAVRGLDERLRQTPLQQGFDWLNRQAQTATTDTGLLGEHGLAANSLRGANDLARRLTYGEAADSLPEGISPFSGTTLDPAIGLGAISTARKSLESLGQLNQGVQELHQGQPLPAVRDIALGGLGALSPQYQFVGNVAAEKARMQGLDDDTADAVGAVAGFMTPGGGLEQLGKGAAYLRRMEGASPTMRAVAGGIEDLSRATGNVSQTPEELAELGRVRSLAPLVAQGFAAPVGGFMAYQKAREEGLDPTATALRTLGGAASLADTAGGVTDTAGAFLPLGLRGVRAAEASRARARTALDAMSDVGVDDTALGTPALGIVTPGAQTLYHGSATPFTKVDPDRFDPAGLYGPGYYMTTSPRIAESYAGEIRGLNQSNADKWSGTQADARAETRKWVDGLLADQGKHPAMDSFANYVDAQMKKMDAYNALAPNRQAYFNGRTPEEWMRRLDNWHDDWVDQTKDPWLVPDRKTGLSQVNEVGDALSNHQMDIDDAFRMGPQSNIRPITVPGGTRLLDIDHPVSDEEDGMIRQALQARKINPDTAMQNVYQAWYERRKGINRGIGAGANRDVPDYIGNDYYRGLESALGGDKDDVNRLLTQAGFDGVTHKGGLIRPLLDDQRHPITHNVDVIFPDRLDKVTNALSGTPYGVSGAVAPPPGLDRAAILRAYPGGAGAFTADALGALGGGVAGGMLANQQEDQRGVTDPWQRGLGIAGGALAGATVGATTSRVGRSLYRGLRALNADESGRLGITAGPGGPSSLPTPEPSAGPARRDLGEAPVLPGPQNRAPTAADARLGAAAEIPPGPGERQVGENQQPRPGDFDRRVQGVHARVGGTGGPMGQAKQVVEETPTGNTWQKGQPTPRADAMEAPPTGQQAVDMASQDASDWRNLTDVANSLPPGDRRDMLLRAAAAMHEKLLSQAQARKDIATQQPGTAGAMATDSIREASRRSRTLAGQAERAARDAAIQGTAPAAEGEEAPEPLAHAVAKAMGGDVAQTEAGPRVTDAAGKVVASRGPAEVDLDGKPVGTPPAATPGSPGAAAAGEAVAPTAPRGRAAATTATAPGTTTTTGTTGTTGTTTAVPKTTTTTTGTTTTAPKTTTTTTTPPPETPETPETPEEPTGNWWFNDQGKLRNMDELEAGHRQQIEDAYNRYKTYRAAMQAATGPGERTRLTAEYRLAEGAKVQKQVAQLQGKSEQDILTLASQDQKIGALSKLADRNLRDFTSSQFAKRDFVTNYARANLIGANPITMARNAMGGVAALAWHPIETLVASAVDKPVGWVYARKGLDASHDRRYGGETGALVNGYERALPAALVNFQHALRQGDEWRTKGLVSEITHEKKNQGKVTNFMRAVNDRLMSPLTATDAFFQTLTQGGEVMRQSYRQMKEAGFSDQQIKDQQVKLLTGPRQGYVDAFNHLATGSGEATAKSLEKGVTDQMEYRAFQQPFDHNDRVGNLIQYISKLPGGSLIVPFVSTPYNAAKFDLERSAAGGAKAAWDLATVGGKNGAHGTALSPVAPEIQRGEMDDRLARGMVGSALFAGLMLNTLNGNLDVNGALPDSQAEKDQWEAEGRKPYTIKAGDRYVSFQEIPGLNAVLTQAAIVKDIRNRYGDDRRDLPSVIQRGILESMKSLAAQPMTGGFMDVARGITDPQQAGAQLTAAIPGTLMPFSGAFRWRNNANDPYQREQPMNPLETYRQIYDPQSLPAKQTAWGDLLENPNQGLGALNPVRTYAAREGEPGFRAPTHYITSRTAQNDVAIGRSAARVQAWQQGLMYGARVPMPSTQDFINADIANQLANPYEEYIRASAASRQGAQQYGRRTTTVLQGSPLEEFLGGSRAY